jgi:hypothetical protein
VANDDARRLRAEGVPITTLDGRKFRLIFDIEAIAAIEDAFGSLGAMQESLEQLSRDQHNAQLFSPLLKMMRAGLVHDPAARDARFDTALVAEYFAAVMKATELAFPKDETTPPALTTIPTDPSPGAMSITSQPSDLGEVMPRSGA